MCKAWCLHLYKAWLQEPRAEGRGSVASLSSAMKDAALALASLLFYSTIVSIYL